MENVETLLKIVVKEMCDTPIFYFGSVTCTRGGVLTFLSSASDHLRLVLWFEIYLSKLLILQFNAMPGDYNSS